MISERYAAMFERVKSDECGAFIPFAMLGDPDPARSLDVFEALIAGGADRNCYRQRWKTRNCKTS